MHELGIVFHIADDVMAVAKENGVEHVAKVVLQVGEVSTIVPHYLVDCWDWNARRYGLLESCQLEVEPIKAVTYCAGCQNLYPTIQYGKICPNCGSPDTWLKTGNEVIIKEIQVDDA